MNHSSIPSRCLPFSWPGLFLMLLAATVPARADDPLLTTPPPPPLRLPAEFEPMQAVVVDWQWGGISNGSFYRYIAEDVKLILLWETDAAYEQLQKDMPKYGVNMDNCEFCQVPRMVIARDSLPWFLFIDQNQPAFVYNGMWGLPSYGLEQGYPVYRSGLYHQGGDFMTDGQGTAVSFDWIATFHAEMGDEFLQRVRDYWGIHTYHLLPNPEIKGVSPPHIDCLAKFLSPDTIMVVHYPPSNPLYERTEAAAAYFGRQISYYGTPYRVVRLDAPNKEPYINSLIVNRRVFVPTMNRPADAGALAAYETAMPGYDVIGISNPESPSSKYSLWGEFWALHCDTMNIPDEKMLYLEHVPLRDRPPASQGFPVAARIIAHSRTEFVEGTPTVLWRTRADANDSHPPASWNTLPMARALEPGEHRYLAYIPAQPVGTVVQYYLQAKDASGRDETHPYIGEAQAHTFAVTTLGANVSAVSARRGGTVEFYINAGSSQAQQAYRLVYSVTGDSNVPDGPSVALPEDTVFTGFAGTLDDLGIAVARMTFPEPLAPAWIGSSLRFALEVNGQQAAVPDTVCVQVLE